MTSRRKFIALSSMGSIGLLGNVNLPANSISTFENQDKLILISRELMAGWTNSLLKLQITDKSNSDYGAMMCPACGRVHGRVADSFYPLLYMADVMNEPKFLDAAILVYRWMENHVSQPDGSWLNDIEKNSWKGITVFTAIALAEALSKHGTLLENDFRKEIELRLKKAADFINRNFSITYGNINYPIAASYALSLIGKLLDVKEFREKGRSLAHEALAFISKTDSFITGEGGPYNEPSAKGCYSVDLGYNVEESLPSLVLYGKLTNDQEILNAILPSLQTHIEFMLPDGAWDNSWGTRNFKWTYWGSRTSDGSQAAYALMADRDPRFYKVALKNTELLKSCTHDGLLYGGPHYYSHQIKPCVHHTFCHAKALATILDHGIVVPDKDIDKLELPREKVYGSRFFKDIQSSLISIGGFRATITGYDREYGMKNGHATGGALTMLWHEKTGPIFSGSMNKYQLKEPNNMQPDNDQNSMPLTPRIELKKDGLFMNISDLKATMDSKTYGGTVIVTANSRLVDQDQVSPASGEVRCKTVYSFQESKVSIEFFAEGSYPGDALQVVLPVVSKSSEKMERVSENQIQIYKGNCRVKISSDNKLEILPTTNGLIFNFVPGLEAIPLAVYSPNCRIEIEVV
jgi:hypothetical protein